jgi:hypothetical protein
MRSLRFTFALVALIVALTALPGRAGAAPSLTIAPNSGPPETRFVATLAGFTPGEEIVLQLAAETPQPLTLTLPAVTIATDGSYSLSINALLLPQGDYSLTAMRGIAISASARFSVTPEASPVPSPPATGNGGYLPGLPSTGGGGSQLTGSDPVVAIGLSALALLFLLVLLGYRSAKVKLTTLYTQSDDSNVRIRRGE